MNCVADPAVPSGEAKPAPQPGAANLASLGNRLRNQRERRKISLRELARRVNVSPSLISQIERGLVMPSVGTLWLVTTELGIAIDELFSLPERTPPVPALSGKGGAPIGDGPIQRREGRKRIRLAGGVVWERLTAQPDKDVEFLHVVYEAGAESCRADELFRHGGIEYAYLLSGRLGLQIGFDSYEMEAGDSVSFNAQMPHRLWAIGAEPAVAIWVVVNRSNDGRGGK
jgi:transcriptional regulator with XRE-family HTH domain